MFISELCSREVIMVHRGDTVFQAAQLMEKHRVGTLVVVEERGGRRVPVGIINDRDLIAQIIERDLVVEIITPELESSKMTVGDIMAANLKPMKENCDVFEAIQLMSSNGTRRLPVVDDEGWLTGIVTLDDLLRYYRYPR